jgi:SAM-dependent methyltransferase
MHLKKRQTCRVCGSKSLTQVVSLGYQYLQGSFVNPNKEIPSTRKIECALVRCNPELDENACGLLQMKYSVPPEILYNVYWYRSGTNNTMRTHLKEMVNEILDTIKSKSGSVLDIGCNDGTQLSYYPESFEKFGIDPSDIATEITGATIFQDTFPLKRFEQELDGKLFDVITSIAMFYDLEKPVEFVKDIKNSLSSSGVWVFEMSYMPDMLMNNSYDTICHEHLEYYSLTVLENILQRGGMKIFKVSLNKINGGSIRCYSTHDGYNKYDNKEDSNYIFELKQKEFDLELDTDKPYQKFGVHINVESEKLNRLIKELKSEGKSIHVYGASTKGNTILQYCKLNNTLIDYAADRNPEKFGSYTLGTNIPIISEEESRAMNPDYYLVLPWHFKQEFLEREKEALDKGTGFIFPLPTLDIYKKQ